MGRTWCNACTSNPTAGCFADFWPRDLLVFQGVARCLCRCHEPLPPEPPKPPTAEECELAERAVLSGDPAAIASLLQDWSTSDGVIEALAPFLPQELAEFVVVNQVRLLRRTSLLEAVESNPNLSNDQKRRLGELRATFNIAPPPRANS